jgi:hypothetical protein
MTVKAEHVDTPSVRSESAYDRYGWMILSCSAVLGIIAALMTTLPPISWFWDPLFESAYSIMGALGVALVGFNVLVLIIVLVPYRRYERWAWFTLWMLPLMWVSQFALATDFTYMVLAMLTTVGLVLPYRRFFSSKEEPARVK